MGEYPGPPFSPQQTISAAVLPRVRTPWSCIIRSASTSMAVVQGMSSFASSTNLDLGVRQPA